MTQIRRVLKPDGTVWVNLGDTYSKSPSFRKSLYGVPERFMINCIDDGWHMRNDIIWSKLCALPDPVKDRFTRNYEHIFFMTKSEKYYFDLDDVRVEHRSNDRRSVKAKARKQLEPFSTPDKHMARGTKYRQEGNYAKVNASRCKDLSKNYYHANGKNPGDVWEYASSTYEGGHYATYPPKMIERIIRCSTKKGDIVLDPFMGAGTTAWVAQKLERDWIGCELNPEYCKLIKERINLGTGIDSYET